MSGVLELKTDLTTHYCKIMKFTFNLAYGPSIIGIAVESDDGQDDVGYKYFDFSDIAIGEKETLTDSFYVVENGGTNIGSRAVVEFTITCKRVALDYEKPEAIYSVDFMIPAGYDYTGEYSLQIDSGKCATAPVLSATPNHFLGLGRF